MVPTQIQLRATTTNTISQFTVQKDIHAEVIKIEIPWKQLEVSLELYFASLS